MAVRARRRTAVKDKGAVAPQPPKVTEPQILHDIIGYALRRAQVAVYSDYARTIAGLDVRPAQFAALAIIAANPGLTQTALATTMGIDRSGAVSLVDALEERGFALRMPAQGDRRSYAIMLTAGGQAMLGQLIERVEDHDRRMTARLSQKERAQLVDLLRRVYER